MLAKWLPSGSDGHFWSWAEITPSSSRQARTLTCATRGLLFGAVGTAGQRCTTTRRIIVHESSRARGDAHISRSLRQVPIGSPLETATLMGPLINTRAVEDMQKALAMYEARAARSFMAASRWMGRAILAAVMLGPASSKRLHDAKMVHEETFAPILYIIPYRDFEQAIAYHNEVPQGLSLGHFHQ